MRNLSYAVTFVLLFFILNSCRIHSGFTHNQNQQQTQVVLSNSNYRVVKYVEGTSVAHYIFAFGGGRNVRGLEARARDNMLREANLVGSSRAVINETVEFQTRQVLFYTEIRCVVSAHIVEFYDPEKEPAPAPEADVLVDRSTQPAAEINKDFYVNLGASFQSKLKELDLILKHKPGGHIAGGINFSTPNFQKLYWGTQLEVAYVDYESTNTYYNHNDEWSTKNIFVTLPFYVGLQTPVGTNTEWLLEGGPRVGLLHQREKLIH